MWLKSSVEEFIRLNGWRPCPTTGCGTDVFFISSRLHIITCHSRNCCKSGISKWFVIGDLLLWGILPSLWSLFLFFPDICLLKRLAFYILTRSWLNAALRFLIRFSGIRLPEKYLARFPVVGLVRVQYPGISIFVMRSDGRDSIATRLYWQGAESFEAAEIRIYRSFLASVDTVLDVGANTGLYALIAAAHSGPGRIYAFEPVPQIAAQLRKNVAANGFEHIISVEAALTDFDGEITMHVPVQPTLALGSSASASFRPRTRAVRVKAMRLDTFSVEHGLPSVDLIKLDTESTEPDVLRGAEALISRDRPLIICEILIQRVLEQIKVFFTGREYRFFRIHADGLHHLSELELNAEATNFLFVPVEKMYLVASDLVAVGV